MYGSLDAAHRWREHFAQVLETGGFSHALSLLRGAYEQQSCDSGPRVVTVIDSEFLWQDTDVATVEHRVRARPAACIPRLEGSGTDQC